MRIREKFALIQKQLSAKQAQLAAVCWHISSTNEILHMSLKNEFFFL